MPKYLCFFLIILNFSWYKGQISDKVRALAQPLENIFHAESAHIDVDGRESKIYNQFKKLAKIANNDELYYFAKNGSNALRLYSSQELFKRNDKRFLELYKLYLQKPLIMNYKMGCIGHSGNIADFLKNEVYSSKDIISLRDFLLKEKNTPDNLTKIQLEQIEDMGYKTTTQENITYMIKQIDEIDTSIQH
ncbi:hypothetical protein [Chryseobacterium sp.]|uniref:hypothetical protein n=1 Tax=Chryseobacterium sp. TaxID=1871047 RepID=UPI00321B0871